MGFKSDIEIAQACEMKDIRRIAEVAGVEEDITYMQVFTHIHLRK